MSDQPVGDPALVRTLKAAGMRDSGHFIAKAGWVSRVWVGDDCVVRLGNGQFRDAFRHEAKVTELLAGSDVPHARIFAHGDGPDGPWSISERLPGRTLHEMWPEADRDTRRRVIESMGTALRALHQIQVPAGMLPPWLIDALAGKPRMAFHPPVIGAALRLVDEARQQTGLDCSLLADVTDWIQQRLPLFSNDRPVLVHGDLHGSNVIVDEGRVLGIIDFAEASAQPADVELDTILRWCARSREYPPSPNGQGLDETSLTDMPGWLRGVYSELFGNEHLRERLQFYDMNRELALYANQRNLRERDATSERIARLLAGRNHLDVLSW